jgi:hypothetical protein
MYGTEMRGLEEGWQETDSHGRFCMTILQTTRFAVGGREVAELQMGRDNRKGKVISVVTSGELVGNFHMENED